jgi:hypothetical protein
MFLEEENLIAGVGATRKRASKLEDQRINIIAKVE